MNTALILSGGIGSRMGTEIPKQYIEVQNRLVISYSIEVLSRHVGIDAIQIVAAPQWHEKIQESLKQYDKSKKFRGFSVPGENRQLSIYYGLTDIRSFAKDSDIVLVHDAARPLLSEQIITDSLSAVEGHDGVLPILSMKDTIYKSEDGRRIDALLDRDQLFAGQAPETFRIGAYYQANRRLRLDQMLSINGAAEPAFMAGLDIVMIAGDEDNFKITTKKDLERFELKKERQIFQNPSHSVS